MDGKVAVVLGVMLLSAAWGVTAIIRIQQFLWSRGRMVSPVLPHPMILEDIRDYGRITRAEFGRAGPLYTHFMTAWLIALASVVTILAMVSLT